MSSRQLQPIDSAAYSQQSAGSSGIGSSVSSSDSSISHASSASPDSSRFSCEEDVEWCGKSTSSRRPSKKRRGDRKRASKGTARQGGAGVQKEVKNAREQDRVRHLRKLYERLDVVLPVEPERGSGHFSKVRTLRRAVRRLKELMRELNAGGNATLSLEEDVTSEEQVVEPSPSPAAPCVASSNISLNCEERLPVEPDAYIMYDTPSYGGSVSSNNSFEALFQEDIPHVLSTAPYFSYSSSPTDYNTPVLGGNCMFPVGNNVPPSASILCSPDLNIPNSSQMMSSLPHPSSLSSSSSHAYHPPDTPTNITPTLEMSPSSQQSYHCGSDMWLAIGCN